MSTPQDDFPSIRTPHEEFAAFVQRRLSAQRRLHDDAAAARIEEALRRGLELLRAAEGQDDPD
jgi:hypothetical protein